MNRNEKDRYNNLKAMHEIVCSMNNENAYYNHWIYLVPDCPQDDDFEFIASDDEIDLYKDCVNCFLRLMRDYSKDGLFIGGNLYSL